MGKFLGAQSKRPDMICSAKVGEQQVRKERNGLIWLMELHSYIISRGIPPTHETRVREECYGLPQIWIFGASFVGITSDKPHPRSLKRSWFLFLCRRWGWMIPWAFVYGVNILGLFAGSIVMFYSFVGAWKTLGLIPLFLGVGVLIGHCCVIFFIIEQKADLEIYIMQHQGQNPGSEPNSPSWYFGGGRSKIFSTSHPTSSKKNSTSALISSSSSKSQKLHNVFPKASRHYRILVDDERLWISWI